MSNATNPQQAHGSPQSAADEPTLSSGGHITFGILLLIAAVVVAGITLAATAPETTFDEAGDPTLGLMIAGVIALAGQIMLAIGVIAKGVKLGNRESRLS